MPTFLQDNRMLAWILAGVAFLIAFVLILKIVEIAVDLRRRIPRGSRARQLRLGFVETFDLDGERQLLLVRRDNVEHLLLIGGPNDVLVESGIVRVEPREGREPRNSRSVEASGGSAAAAAAFHSRAARGRTAACHSGAASLLHSRARADPSARDSRRAAGEASACAPAGSESCLRAAGHRARDPALPLAAPRRRHETRRSLAAAPFPRAVHGAGRRAAASAFRDASDRAPRGAGRAAARRDAGAPACFRA